MTRSEALIMAGELVSAVRNAKRPATVARSAVLPLQLPSLFSKAEVREVGSFLYLMKRRDNAEDADFVADAFATLVKKLSGETLGRMEPGTGGSRISTDR